MKDNLFSNAREDFGAQGLLRACQDVSFQSRVAGILQELMMLDPIGAERDQIMEIATLLLPWCRDGNYGCLFDGISNLSLTGKIAHFELGYIPESEKELKAAAGFLITNHARKHIITLPRAVRKRNVYEEVARFLDIPGGQEIVQESYAQLRKFN